ncbi:MAG: hypothetical protein CMP39_07155 [Rickettsiales bacterium]|nr:hypothetical protein [Rickettsiales bacterium]|tara:strand:+ start:1327 stop:2688 length:1362 start_codon:yes stop_codon:yes gene_type:complete
MTIDKLIKQLGKEKCSQLSSTLADYKTDKSYEEGVVPALLVIAQSAIDIKIVLDFANKYKIPLTVRGAGSGKSGGAIPEKGGILLSLEKLDQILDLDLNNSCITVEPGVITDTIKDAAKQVGLFYPPDPSSSDWCTIGGNIAENSGSSNALKYGVTGDYVLGLEGFFANGEPFKLGGKLYKDVAGYDLKKLLVGSEGTLAIITKIILKLIPQPKVSESIWCCFDTMSDACDYLQRIARSSLRPAAAEFLEKACVDAVEKIHQKTYPFNTGNAVVLCRFDAQSSTELNDMLNIAKDEISHFENTSVFTGNEEDYWFVRRATSKALEQAYGHKTSEDVTVPPAEIATYLAAIKTLDPTSEITFVGYGHLGDGNIHTNILMHQPNPKRWKEIKQEWVKKVLELCISMGGTLTGEHGIGVTKKEYMPMYFSESEIKIMKQIKAVFDPNNILNPSKVI